jgi:hypothetical protein
MPTKQRRQSLTTSYKKQNGLHHKQNKKYLKAYWPYLPILLLMIVGIVTSFTILYIKPDFASTYNFSVNSLLSATNDERIDNNKSSLAISQQLDVAAQNKANNMASLNYWSHDTPTGQTPWTFIKDTGYQFETAGENLAYGFSNSSQVLSAWMNSASHKANILDASYTNVGFGIAHSDNYQGKGEQTIIVAMYASPTGAVTSANTQISLNSAKPYTNLSDIQPNPITVSRISDVTVGYTSWLIFSIGLIGGATVMFLIIRHGLLIKKWAVEGERVVIKHPLLDIVLVLVVVGCATLIQTVGFIN